MAGAWRRPRARSGGHSGGHGGRAVAAAADSADAPGPPKADERPPTDETPNTTSARAIAAERRAGRRQVAEGEAVAEEAGPEGPRGRWWQPREAVGGQSCLASFDTGADWPLVALCS